MAKTREYAFVYLFGGIMYGLMEVIWRGHTHWTMTLTGGTALLILYIINIKMSNCNIFLKCLIGASAITLLEFTVGVIINIILKWNVWNYVVMLIVIPLKKTHYKKPGCCDICFCFLF